MIRADTYVVVHELEQDSDLHRDSCNSAMRQHIDPLAYTRECAQVKGCSRFSRDMPGSPAIVASLPNEPRLCHKTAHQNMRVTNKRTS